MLAITAGVESTSKKAHRSAAGRVRRLAGFVGDRDGDVLDPYGENIETRSSVRDRVEKLVISLLDLLEREHSKT